MGPNKEVESSAGRKSLRPANEPLSRRLSWFVIRIAAAAGISTLPFLATPPVRAEDQPGIKPEGIISTVTPTPESNQPMIEFGEDGIPRVYIQVNKSNIVVVDGIPVEVASAQASPPAGGAEPVSTQPDTDAELIGGQGGGGDTVSTEANTTEAKLFPERKGILERDFIELNNMTNSHGADFDDFDSFSRIARKFDRKIRITIHKKAEDVPGTSGPMDSTHVYGKMFVPVAVSETGEPSGAVIQFGVNSAFLTPDGVFDLHYGYLDNVDTILTGSIIDNLGKPDIYAEYRRQRASWLLSSNVAAYIEYGKMPLSWPVIIDKNGIAQPAPLTDETNTLVNPNPLLKIM